MLWSFVHDLGQVLMFPTVSLLRSFVCKSQHEVHSQTLKINRKNKGTANSQPQNANECKWRKTFHHCQPENYEITISMRKLNREHFPTPNHSVSHGNFSTHLEPNMEYETYNYTGIINHCAHYILVLIKILQKKMKPSWIRNQKRMVPSIVRSHPFALYIHWVHFSISSQSQRRSSWCLCSDINKYKKQDHGILVFQVTFFCNQLIIVSQETIKQFPFYSLVT